MSKTSHRKIVGTFLAISAVVIVSACSSQSPDVAENASVTTEIEGVATANDSTGTSTIESESTVNATSDFVVTSSAMTDGGTLPVQFTCDGASQSPPLSWAGAPSGTKSFAVLMDHQPGPGDWHWYWTLWGIPSSTSSIAVGTNGGATIGTNSVNGELSYAPPCSKGPGEKAYTFTVYALSSTPTISNASSIDRTALLAAIDDITLASSSLTVTYSRS